MGKELLLEIGTEEIPAAFLPKAMQDLEEMGRREFAACRLAHGAIRSLATPRRLCLVVGDLAERQEDLEVEKMGPARKAAFDAQGQPTKAALGFARGQGVELGDVGTVVTEKGEYLCVRKTIAGEPTEALLPEILPRLILGLPFKKSMRWSDLDIRFARPIHWLLALYGGRVVPFTLGNVRSGNLTQGHRFMSPEAFAVQDFADYLARTKERCVIVDPAERKAVIRQETRRAAAQVSGRALEDEALLEQVVFLTEYPTVVCGSFDRDYLRLPQEVLVTSMISHQKYFPVVDAEGRLLPHFLTVNNTLARDPSVVARGNEKVIRARLSDAHFFFTEDQKVPLTERVEGLKRVVYHTQLGTSFEKVMRFKALALTLADRIDPALKETVERAALLAKADLDTQMVGEFSELQGVMGREYALLAGEDPTVARAIYEHYLPTQAGGALPVTDAGAIVSIADKMDTIAGFFAVKLIPTGTADPYALRRQALGIINILLAKRYPIRLDELVDRSLGLLEEKAKRPAGETRADILDFFRGRLENQLIAQGRPYDVVDAVLATGFSDLVRTVAKIEAMEAFKAHENFEPLAIAFKRVGNILKDFPGGSVREDLLETAEERTLYRSFREIRTRALTHLDAEDYPAALVEMAGIRQPVDAFFETVLVMAKEEAIRNNRLALLAEISALFHRVADFAKIVTGV